MRFLAIVSAGIVAACAVGAASAQTLAATELAAPGSGLPLLGWVAVLVILIGTGVTVYRMLRGSPPKRRVNGQVPRAR